MGSIHSKIKDDDVAGLIVGGNYIVGALFYDGRRQYGQEFAKTENKLKEALLEKFNKIKKESGSSFELIYPANKWNIRIYD